MLIYNCSSFKKRKKKKKRRCAECKKKKKKKSFMGLLSNQKSLLPCTQCGLKKNKQKKTNEAAFLFRSVNIGHVCTLLYTMSLKMYKKFHIPVICGQGLFATEEKTNAIKNKNQCQYINAITDAS